jgi:hypothetical protein
VLHHFLGVTVEPHPAGLLLHQWLVASVGGLVCVLSSFLFSLELRCAGSLDCVGCWSIRVLGP